MLETIAGVKPPHPLGGPWHLAGAALPSPELPMGLQEVSKLKSMEPTLNTALGQGKVQMARLGRGVHPSWPHHSNKVWFNAVMATFTLNGRAPSQDLA